MELKNFNDAFPRHIDAYIKFKEYINQGITIEELAYYHCISIEKVISILVRFDEVIDPVVCNSIKQHYSKFSINDNKAIIISDTHIGSYYEYLELFDIIFNFCSLYGIKNIIHAGDLLEGNSHMPNRKDPINIQVKKIMDIFNQKGIPKMFYLYGNHEYNLEVYDFIHLKQCLIELEKLIYIGSGNSYIQLNDNDPINIYHKLSFNRNYVPDIDTNLKLIGHHHVYDFDNNNTIFIPPLSLVNKNDNLGFIVLKTTGNEFILDVYKGLQNKIINHYEQKVIKKHL